MRHNSAKPRVIYPDLFYQSELVAKLTNKVMKQGKKALAQKIVYQALHLVNKQTNRKPLEVLQEAYQNVTPKLELALRKVRSATYRIPTETTERRQQVLALR